MEANVAKDFVIFKTDEGYSCGLTPISDYIQFGLIDDHAQKEKRTPVLNIGFPIEKYARLSVLFREMQRSKPILDLYISENQPGTYDLTVFMLYNNPTPDIIRDVLRDAEEGWGDGADTWTALTARIHVSMHREETLRFLQRFLNAKKAIIVFLETIDGEPPENPTLEGKNPVSTFTISLDELTLKSFF